jgi:IclR family pca regulon transcriptional regulator
MAPAPVSSTQSLERGLSILSALAAEARPLTLTEMGDLAGLSKSTCHRYAVSLAALGFLELDAETRKYVLGPAAVSLGYAAMGSLDVVRVAGGPLRALADETGHTASLAVLDGADIVYVERRRPGHARPRLELSVQVGTRLPAYCTSMGKVLLAHADPAVVRPILDRTDLARRGPKTITAREQLTRTLADVAAHGIAVNDEELAPGLRSIAVPVRDHTGQVVAAAGISVHLGAWNASIDVIVSRLNGPLRRTAEDISHHLGYLGKGPTA